MEALIDDLLTFSRTIRTEESPPGNADLGIAFNEALTMLKNTVDETGAVITALPLPTVRGDASQYTHVFLNLLSNALKYHRLNVTPRIDIGAIRQSEEWVISVRDNGIGFEQQYAQRIFGLFKRLHKEQYPGTGLGLAICQRIVERYGGRIWAEAEPGSGAVFHFALRGA
jgi:light-regulated signal transduction histidine kinase (bacteriophytochrome)